MTDKELAMLGDREAQERITERGELLPCPRCGEQQNIRWFSSDGKHGGYYCSYCNQGQFPIYRTEAKEWALGRWNKRSQILGREQIDILKRAREVKGKVFLIE